MKFKKIVKYSALGIFLLVQVYLFFFKNIEVMDYYPYSNEYPLPLSGENKNISQEFRTPGPLARIDIMMANYKIKPKGGILRLTIYKNSQLRFLENYPANTVEDNRFCSFNVNKKIPADNYRLQLDYFPKDKKEKLAVWSSKRNLYPFGNLYVNGEKIQGDLTFRVYFNSTIRKEKDRWLSLTKKSGFRGIALAVGFILMIVLLNLVFYYFLNKLLKKPTSND